MPPPFKRWSLRQVPLGTASIALCLQAGSALAADPLSSTDRLRQLMEQVRAQPLASQSGDQAVREAETLSPARLQTRAALLKTGEAALVRLDVHAALDAFEGATQVLHAADSEIALVRTYMQGGYYRRALTLGAHTAGAHLDVIGGSTLYAWLLHVGGQPAMAQRLLAGSESRMPGNPMVATVQLQLRSLNPVATGQLLAPPTRLAPYGETQDLPDTARVVGSALLLPSGTACLMPLSLVPRSGQLWLRNGLGQLVKARVDKILTDVNIALVKLEGLLPTPEEFLVAAGDAWPGSAGFAVEYVSTPDAAPAWPVLHTGWLGGAKGDTGEQLLGFDLPAGPRGGPVFDGSGRWIGLALQGSPGAAGQTTAGNDTLVTVSQLRKALNTALASEPWSVQDTPSPMGPRPRNLVEKVYEVNLKVSLQVITSP